MVATASELRRSLKLRPSHISIGLLNALHACPSGRKSFLYVFGKGEHEITAENILAYAEAGDHHLYTAWLAAEMLGDEAYDAEFRGPYEELVRRYDSEFIDDTAVRCLPNRIALSVATGELLIRVLFREPHHPDVPMLPFPESD